MSFAREFINFKRRTYKINLRGKQLKSQNGYISNDILILFNIFSDLFSFFLHFNCSYLFSIEYITRFKFQSRYCLQYLKMKEPIIQKCKLCIQVYVDISLRSNKMGGLHLMIIAAIVNKIIKLFYD